MRDEERAQKLIESLSSNYYINPTKGAFTRMDSDVAIIAAAFAAIRQEERERVQEYIQRWYDSGLQWLEREATP